MEKYGDMACPSCTSHDTVLADVQETTAGTVNTIRCQKCGNTWTYTTPIPKREPSTGDFPFGMYDHTED